jgi:hypothetical protein
METLVELEFEHFLVLIIPFVLTVAGIITVLMTFFKYRKEE